LATDTIPDEGVVERNVLAHQELAGFLSSYTTEEGSDVVNLGVTHA
jgi:hypothetical protein